MSGEDKKNFRRAEECHICARLYTEKEIRLWYYCHISGRCRGSAHKDCSVSHFRLRFEDRKIPVIFHNLWGYDIHFIMQEIGKIANKYAYNYKKGEDKQMDINVIPNNMEKYMAFMLGKHLVIFDSFQFMRSCVDRLASNLPDEVFKYTWVGMSILDLSKTFLYDFHYNNIKSKYHDKAKLLFTDTENSTYEIGREDVYKDFWAVKDKFDNCEYPENSQIFDKTNKKVISKFKDEAFGVPITKFVGLRSKMSAYIKEDD